MNYKKLRTQAVKEAYLLTEALLGKDKKLIELETFKLNNTITDLLEVMKKENLQNEEPTTTIERISKNLKKWR